MPLSRGKQLTAQFYLWEQRGRGWQLANYPVDLEPVFDPFVHFIPTEYIDDGKRPTLLSTFSSLFSNQSPGEATNHSSQYLLEKEPTPYSYEDAASDLCGIRVMFQKGFKVSSLRMEELFIVLSQSRHPISFEIIGDRHTITIQFVCSATEQRFFQSQLKAYFPDCIVQDTTDLLDNLVLPDQSIYIADFGLQEEFMRPLAMSVNFDHDPYTGLFGILEQLQDEEYAVIQILFSKTINHWEESIINSVSDSKGGCFFLDAPEMLPLAVEKTNAPLFAVTVRALAQAASLEEASAVLERIGRSLMLLSKGKGNALIPLNDTAYDVNTRIEDMVLRQSHRTGMLLNVKELITLAHFPSASIVSQKLTRGLRKTKAAPPIAEGHEYILGTNIHEGSTREVSLAPMQRLKHMHIIGATGTGKSTLLLNLIEEDITQGNGIAVLDPHGDLIDSILSRIPPKRKSDVVLIDPSDTEYSVGFNILTAHSDIEKDVLSSDLVSSFRKLSTSWGDQMNSVFANAILAFLESKTGGTLADVRRFLIEKSFRDQFLQTVRDPNIVYYWQKEFPILKSNSVAPILTRLDTFLRPKLIRNMVIQKKGLDFETLLDTQKIILVKASQGLIGTENSYLLGTMIVSKIHQAAMARQNRNKEDRKNFFVYIDEFQNFMTPSMSSILSGARKYHLGLILAHQDLQQLQRADGELANSVLSNAGTRLCFRVGDADARKLEDGFSFFTALDLQNLHTGEAIARIERPDYDFTLSIYNQPDFESGENIRDEIIELSRTTYATKVRDIEIVIPENEAPITNTPAATASHSEKENKPPPQEIQKKPVEIPPHVPHEVAAEINTEPLLNRKATREHSYLQRMIKLTAEGKGYKATLEVPTPDTSGLVDVLLERNNKTIACEICVTTDAQWELHNIEKCITAGYETIVELCSDTKALQKIKCLVEEKIQVDISHIHFFTPEEFFEFLNKEIANEAATETRLKGYRVQVKYDALTDTEMKKKRESVARIVADSLKKIKE